MTVRSKKVYHATASANPGTREARREVARNAGIGVIISLGSDYFPCPTCNTQYKLPSKAMTCCRKGK